MASTPRYLSSFARGLACPFLQPARPNSAILPFLYPIQQQSRDLQTKSKTKDEGTKKKRKKVLHEEYDKKNAIQFSLCDAMRYIRAFEVGRDLASVKYELHIKIRTKKDGPIIRNQLRLPHPAQPDARVCVICPPGSKAEKEAKSAGAAVVGEEAVFEDIKAGKIEFEACICHTSSLVKLEKAGLGRTLGPKGLMPSVKLGTVVDKVGTAVQNSRGSSSYRERDGLVQLAIGQLGFSPEELRTNMREFVGQVKQDANKIEQVTKEIVEIVLSSTNSPGFILNGDFRTDKSPPTAALTGH